MTKKQVEMLRDICEHQLRKGNNKQQIKRLYLETLNALKIEEIRNNVDRKSN